MIWKHLPLIFHVLSDQVVYELFKYGRWLWMGRIGQIWRHFPLIILLMNDSGCTAVIKTLADGRFGSDCHVQRNMGSKSIGLILQWVHYKGLGIGSFWKWVSFPTRWHLRLFWIWFIGESKRPVVIRMFPLLVSFVVKGRCRWWPSLRFHWGNWMLRLNFHNLWLCCPNCQRWNKMEATALKQCSFKQIENVISLLLHGQGLSELMDLPKLMTQSNTSTAISSSISPYFKQRCISDLHSLNFKTGDQ